MPQVLVVIFFLAAISVSLNIVCAYTRELNKQCDQLEANKPILETISVKVHHKIY